jgi:hypothetical protein
MLIPSNGLLTLPFPVLLELLFGRLLVDEADDAKPFFDEALFFSDSFRFGIDPWNYLLYHYIREH